MTIHLHIRHLWRRKPMVLVAILFMGSSALVTYFFVNENNRHVLALKQEQQKLEVLIRDDWDDANRANRDVDTTVIVSLLANNTPEGESLRHYYLSRLQEHGATKVSLLQLAQEANATRALKIDAINETYVKQLDLENDIMDMEQKNMIYANIAFFMQIIGLVLVIVTRDMPDI